jgi:hypothetical protein
MRSPLLLPETLPRPRDDQNPYRRKRSPSSSPQELLAKAEKITAITKMKTKNPAAMPKPKRAPDRNRFSGRWSWSESDE